MKLSEIDRAKIIVAVDKLKREASRLEKEAQLNESYYCSALATYGSELAGPPASIQADRKLAELLRAKADFFHNTLDCPLDVKGRYERRKVARDDKKGKIVELNEKIKYLEEEIKLLESEMSYLHELDILLTQ